MVPPCHAERPDESVIPSSPEPFDKTQDKLRRGTYRGTKHVAGYLFSFLVLLGGLLMGSVAVAAMRIQTVAMHPSFSGDPIPCTSDMRKPGWWCNAWDGSEGTSGETVCNADPICHDEPSNEERCGEKAPKVCWGVWVPEAEDEVGSCIPVEKLEAWAQEMCKGHCGPTRKCGVNSYNVLQGEYACSEGEFPGARTECYDGEEFTFSREGHHEYEGDVGDKEEFEEEFEEEMEDEDFGNEEFAEQCAQEADMMVQHCMGAAQEAGFDGSICGEKRERFLNVCAGERRYDMSTPEMSFEDEGGSFSMAAPRLLGDLAGAIVAASLEKDVPAEVRTKLGDAAGLVAGFIVKPETFTPGDVQKLWDMLGPVLRAAGIGPGPGGPGGMDMMMGPPEGGEMGMMWGGPSSEDVREHMRQPMEFMGEMVEKIGEVVGFLEGEGVEAGVIEELAEQAGGIEQLWGEAQTLYADGDERLMDFLSRLGEEMENMGRFADARIKESILEKADKKFGFDEEPPMMGPPERMMQGPYGPEGMMPQGPYGPMEGGMMGPGMGMYGPDPMAMQVCVKEHLLKQDFQGFEDCRAQLEGQSGWQGGEEHMPFGDDFQGRGYDGERGGFPGRGPYGDFMPREMDPEEMRMMMERRKECQELQGDDRAQCFGNLREGHEGDAGMWHEGGERGEEWQEDGFWEGDEGMGIPGEWDKEDEWRKEWEHEQRRGDECGKLEEEQAREECYRNRMQGEGGYDGRGPGDMGRGTGERYNFPEGGGPGGGRMDNGSWMRSGEGEGGMMRGGDGMMRDGSMWNQNTNRSYPGGSMPGGMPGSDMRSGEQHMGPGMMPGSYQPSGSYYSPGSPMPGGYNYQPGGTSGGYPSPSGTTYPQYQQDGGNTGGTYESSPGGITTQPPPQ